MKNYISQLPENKFHFTPLTFLWRDNIKGLPQFKWFWKPSAKIFLPKKSTQVLGTGNEDVS